MGLNSSKVVELLEVINVKVAVIIGTSQDFYNDIIQTKRRKEGNVLFNDILNTFYVWLYGVGYMVKDHLDSERGIMLLPHWLHFPISSKVSFILNLH